MKEPFSRALVALDLSPMDETLIAYAAGIAPVLGIKRLYFVHIMPSLTEPENLDAEFHSMFNPEQPLDEKIAHDISQVVEREMAAQPEVKWSVEVREGKPYQKLMHWIDVKEVNLLIVGKKQRTEGSGITAQRVARKAGCNVLFVTREASAVWKNLLSPIDFSENSARALKLAMDICAQLNECAIRAAYVVEMPMNDFYLQQITAPDYHQMLMASARTAADNFLRTFDLNDNLPIELLENNFGNISRHLAEYAESEQPDLLIIGAQGHSGLEKFLYGSVTESLLDKLQTRPVLIVR